MRAGAVFRKWRGDALFSWSTIFSETGFHPRIKSKGKLLGIML
jgi:hypothetical protein